MKTPRITLALALLGLAACSAHDTTAPSPSGPNLRLANGMPGTGAAGVVLLVDGVQKATAAFGAVAAPVAVAPGTHIIEVRAADSASGYQDTVAVGEQENRYVVAVSGSGPLIVEDTNAIVPAGHSKLRVIHAAAAAPAITVRRTQPDYDSLVTVMFPFPYGASSGYVQSTPGTWTIVVSHENQQDTLVATGNIAIPDGHSRTVLLLDDGAGGVQATIVDP